MPDVIMPKAGDAMDEGLIVQWLKNVGDTIGAEDTIVEVETDKGHDAFLLHEPELFATLRGFLTGCAEHRGLTRHWG